MVVKGKASSERKRQIALRALSEWLSKVTPVFSERGQIVLRALLRSELVLFFIYRRPTLYPVEIAVDFLKSL
jgi:hypothetical protein